MSLSESEVQRKKEELLNKIQDNVQWALKDVEEPLKSDKDFLYLACQMGAYTLMNASDELRNDKDFVMACAKVDYGEFQWASDELLNDRDFVLNAIKECNTGLFMGDASEKLRHDKSFVLDACKINAHCLKRVPEEFWKDPDVIQTVLSVYSECQMKGYTLKTLPDELRSNKDFVMGCAKIDPNEFQYASDELLNDRDFVLNAIEECNAPAFVGNASELRQDKSFVLEACKINGNCIKFASDKLKTDADVIHVALAFDNEQIPSAEKDMQI